MAAIREFRASHSFHGIIWNTLADPYKSRLYLEVRDTREKKVSFSALNLQNNQWLWKNIVFDERWWVSLGAAAGDVLLLTLYTDTGNPDKKSLLAYHVIRKEIIWWKNSFALSAANSQYVMGEDSAFSSQTIILDLFNGNPVRKTDFHLVDSQNFPVIRPFHYEDGSDYFKTVSNFLKSRVGIVPVISMEYLEWERYIISSVFVGEQDLANYLYIMDTSGEVLLAETLGEGLKGVGFDTFFVYSGHLIFVKNKHELVSYKIV